MHKNKMIFVTSSLQYDIIRVMPFHILIFDMISIISNLILKALFRALIWGAGNA